MIQIVPYDPEWPRQFEIERERIAAALGGAALRIDHVGSTSVPGLAAKPVIDIQISVARLHPLDRYRAQLESLGYRHRPHPDDACCPYFHKPVEKPHTHHVHVVEANGREERHTLRFRDHLRAHPEAAMEYEALKRRLASQISVEDSYADAKGSFVEGIIDAAAVEAYYNVYAEEDRLSAGPFALEYERTKDILTRVLPPPPARIVDVGGAAGTYSLWLARLGYEVHLVDATARLVDEAGRRSAAAAHPLASASVGDARRLPQTDSSADAVLVMGPLYHLTTATDRLAALREAFRVLRTGGTVAAAAISRYAAALDGLATKASLDPVFAAIRDRDLADGQHRNETGNPRYFTTAYFHRPEDLREELDAVGFHDAAVLGIEGPGWILGDFDTRWANPLERADMMAVARAVEAEPSVIGASAHLLAIARRR